jgi:hypothetical protein
MGLCTRARQDWENLDRLVNVGVGAMAAGSLSNRARSNGAGTIDLIIDTLTSGLTPVIEARL